MTKVYVVFSYSELFTEIMRICKVFLNKEKAINFIRKCEDFEATRPSTDSNTLMDEATWKLHDDWVINHPDHESTIVKVDRWYYQEMEVQD